MEWLAVLVVLVVVGVAWQLLEMEFSKVTYALKELDQRLDVMEREAKTRYELLATLIESAVPAEQDDASPRDRSLHGG